MLYGAFFARKTVKPWEEGRLNPAYCQITSDLDVHLIPSVPYIWVLTSENQLILGVEEPWNYPEAFHINVSRPQDAQVWMNLVSKMKLSLIDRSTVSALMTATSSLVNGVVSISPSPESVCFERRLGHPTIAVRFSDHLSTCGTMTPEPCRLGGDLYCDNGQWVINNRSGRYGCKHESSLEHQEQIEQTLIYASEILQRKRIPVVPRLYFSCPHPNFISDIFAGGTRDLLKIRQ
jgi:hypothetical protein